MIALIGMVAMIYAHSELPLELEIITMCAYGILAHMQGFCFGREIQEKKHAKKYKHLLPGDTGYGKVLPTIQACNPTNR